MSGVINNKPYDALQKIKKAIFRGSPNLVTAPDYNRSLDIMASATSDVQRTSKLIGGGGIVSYTVENATQVASGEYSPLAGAEYLVLGNITISDILVSYNGAQFVIPQKVFSGTQNLAVGVEVNFIVIAKEVLHTRATDAPDYLISGAKFSDGTIKDAADHIVYEEEQVIMTIGEPFQNIPSGYVGLFIVHRLQLCQRMSYPYYSIAEDRTLAVYSQAQLNQISTVRDTAIGGDSYTGTLDDMTEFPLPIASDSFSTAIWKLAVSFYDFWRKSQFAAYVIPKITGRFLGIGPPVGTDVLDVYIAGDSEAPAGEGVYLPKSSSGIMVLDTNKKVTTENTNNFVRTSGDLTINGEKTFSDIKRNTTPSDNDDLTNKGYVDNLILWHSGIQCIARGNLTNILINGYAKIKATTVVADAEKYYIYLFLDVAKTIPYTLDRRAHRIMALDGAGGTPLPTIVNTGDKRFEVTCANPGDSVDIFIDECLF
jgi:hypothetical protein